MQNISCHSSGLHVKLKAMGDSLMLKRNMTLNSCATESFIWDARSIMCMNHHQRAFPSHSPLCLKYALCFSLFFDFISLCMEMFEGCDSEYTVKLINKGVM